MASLEGLIGGFLKSRKKGRGTNREVEGKVPFLKLIGIGIGILGGLLHGVATKNILALEWHNSFCALHPRTKECALQFFDDWASTHFTLHGLWPQNRTYCSRTPLRLSSGLLQLLRQYMPGVLEGLHYHEWQKHGTCFGTDPQTYFLTAVRLTREFNQQERYSPNRVLIGVVPTPIQRYFANHIGQYLTLSQIRWLFKKSFGLGNGRKFQLVCEKGRLGTNYITEIRVYLTGDPTRLPLQQLIDNAPEVV
ncbi:MAG: hypothetical protein ABGW77_00645, partial [Campylobacterales bacterium]